MDSAFLEAYNNTLKLEGGYSNRASDSGGATYKGVTHTTYDRYRKKHGLPLQDVRKISEQELLDIYKGEYWNLSFCDFYPRKLAILVYDYAVNSGPERAVKDLQYVILAKTDGVFGPNSVSALNTALAKIGEDELCKAYLDVRKNFFISIAHGKNSANLKGWLNRIKLLKNYILV